MKVWAVFRHRFLLCSRKRWIGWPADQAWANDKIVAQRDFQMSGHRLGGKTLAGQVVMVALLANLSIAALALSTETAAGFLGQPLLEVEQRDFFKGFHLAEFAKRETPYNAKVVVFKPNQTSIHFEVAATVDKNESVLAIQLWLRRSFVDETEVGPFARNVVQKFLKEAPPSEDVRRLTDLANEIQYRDVASSSAAGAEPAHVRLPAKPSDGYLAFMGKQKTYELVLGTSRLQILNYRDRYGEVMTLQIVPIGNGKREQAGVRRLRAALA
jgi:hypothetical protein